MESPLSKSISSVVKAFKILFWNLGGLLMVFQAGCFVPANERAAKVVAGPAPLVSADRALPSFDEANPDRAWSLAEVATLTDPVAVKFAAAREAYWNYETETAVSLLRELLRGTNQFQTNHLHNLILQCYERSDRWSEAAALFPEFGMEKSQADRLAHDRFMASLPRMSFDFATNASPIEISHVGPDWVIVDGVINGTKARLFVDTGFSGSMLTVDFAKRTGARVHAETIDFSDANGHSRPVPIGTARELQLGGTKVRDLPVVVDNNFLLRRVLHADGVIGWDVLQHMEVTWDFPARLMSLRAPHGSRASPPNLCGRRLPLLKVISPEGRPLDLFLDTGFSDSQGCLEFYDNAGVLATKTSISQFRRSWKPTFKLGAFSLSISWPRRAKSYSFWMGGYLFESPGGEYSKGIYTHEDMVCFDGMIGNAPFLGGKLTISGTRREAVFEPKAAEKKKSESLTQR